MARERTLGLKLKAIDRMSGAIDRVQSKFPKLARDIRRASRASKIFNAQTKQMRQMLTKVGGKMQSFGRGLASFVTLPLAAAGVAGVKFFGDFEQGLKGVEKTTGIGGKEIEKLGNRFSQLSTEIPVSTQEMLELAQAGGQLGIKGAGNIEKFTVTMAKLSRASDVAGEEGAKSIARILAVTGAGTGKVDQFASALVDLGNNAAASESEILEVSNRVAGAIGRFDVGADKVLGISTALKALGKNAEAGGSVVGRAFDAIDQSIKKGGVKIQLLSKLTGIAAKDLDQAFKKDATAVFEKFIIGVSKVQKGGGNMVKVLGALGLQGVRINDIIGTLAKRPEELTKNLDRAGKAFKENTALQKEFAIQTDSQNSRIKTLMGSITDFLKLVGKDLAPVVRFAGEKLKSFFDFLRESPVVRKLAIVFGVLLAVLGPILIAFGGFLLILPGLTAGLAALGVTSLAAFAPFLIIGAKILLVIGVIALLIIKFKAIKEFFNENPFGKFLKAVFLLFTPLGRLISLVRLVAASFQGLKQIKSVVADFLPFGLAEKFGLAPEKDAKKKTEGIAQPQAGAQTAVNGQIGVNFSNVPAGTKIRSESEGPVGLNLGFAGGAL